MAEESAPQQKTTRTSVYGFILPLIVVFGAIFLTIGLGLTGYLLELQHAADIRTDKEQAFDIAEAGANYYAWHLAHFPTDLQDGTGGSGPYVHTYADPQGGTAGTYTLSIAGNTQCGQPTSVDITSIGATASDPTHTSTVFARYAHDSVANYSFIVNTAVWAGSVQTIYGRYHSNGGVRMDSNNQSTVESAVPTWTCTKSFGCSPSATEPGVFGAGTNPGLWKYPVPTIDFSQISVDLASLKSYAQNNGGIYLAPASGAQNQRGYHLIFKSDGTVDVKQVTQTTPVWSYSANTNTWAQEYNIIALETFLGNYSIPSSCSVIYVEDRAWIEGVVKGKVTIAAGNLIDNSYVPDIIIPNNLTYLSDDGTNGLTAVSQGSVLIPLNSPDTMIIYGILVAQNGFYGRNYYCYPVAVPYCTDEVPSIYQSDILRSSLTTVGTVVSNGRVGVTWLCGGSFCSGYSSRSASYDGTLTSSPPPFTPYTSNLYHFSLWRQQ